MISQRIYVRDNRSPKPKSQTVSKTMSAIKSKNTTPEILIRKALWANRIKGYRLHRNNLPGKPDISFNGIRKAIFINGCFWHRCPNCNLSLPKNNMHFWQSKFNSNVERDRIKIHELSKLGFSSITIWECQIRNDITFCISKIKTFLKE
jgi:DNA mismatch endonuclease (patch repair protein)